MNLKNSLKFSVMKKPLELKKTRDFCPSKKPRLTIVMVHGIASSSNAFRNTINYLSGTASLKDVRFVAFDLLGAGKSYSSDKLKYSLEEQIEALQNSISKLNLTTPLVLLGHSLGSLISLNYADTHKKTIKKLILASPPLYLDKELKHPAFIKATKNFEKIAKERHKDAYSEKQFARSMNEIILSEKNYKVASKITTDTLIIYGDQDPFISAYNINKIAKENPKHVKVIKTIGTHHMSRDKYHKLVPILEEILNA